ncbi:unnamed protein product [Paramecium octaurelia]|uniref:Uncharacterized protein n=1 Tax=Paramecium octaurelia TaxID=43137 RepID=A0A8S1XHM1_PAROT|nr:unnamed protein product [Paramecium octaurelia]
MQSEQLKLMQTQIIDLQRALLNQMQQPHVQQPLSPPRNEQTFHPSNKRMGLPVIQKLEQEIEEIAKQILCDKIESMQNSTRNSVNQLISYNNSNKSDTSNQFKISTNKKQSLDDLTITMKESDIKRQITTNQILIQYINGNIQYENHQNHSQSFLLFLYRIQNYKKILIDKFTPQNSIKKMMFPNLTI